MGIPCSLKNLKMWWKHIIYINKYVSLQLLKGIFCLKTSVPEEDKIVFRIF